MRVITKLFSILFCLILPCAVSAIQVIQDSKADSLICALIRQNSGIRVLSYNLEYCTSQNASSSGTYTNDAGTYGIGSGIVVSTGDVESLNDWAGTGDAYVSYSYGNKASEETNSLLGQITECQQHYDATRLDIFFDLLPGYDSIGLNAVFGTDEYPRYQNTMFNDGLGVFVNDNNIARVLDQKVNISHGKLAALIGTELNGVLAVDANPLLLFSTFLGNGSLNNRLSIVIGDASDSALDTTAFLSNMHAYSSVPEPGGLTTLATGSAIGMLGFLRTRSKKRK